MEAPIMLLSGHSGEIYTAKFHPEGNVLASAGFDRQICKRKSTNPGKILENVAPRCGKFVSVTFVPIPMSYLSVFWNVYGECDNFHVINSAHSGAILDLHFSSPDSGGNSIYTASTDKTVGVFDVASGSR